MPKKCNAKVESKSCDRSSFATCDGCHQSFCIVHLNAHQKELGNQMEQIVCEHDLLHEELSKHRIQSQYELPDFAHEFSLIDAWQTRTLAQVTKIVTQEADRARNVIQLIMDKNQRRTTSNMVAISEEFERLKKRLAMLSEHLQERMKTSDYLEPDLRQWQNQLNDIKKCSMAPQVSTCMIINKLTVRETRPIQINASNILDIKYDDTAETDASNSTSKTNGSVEAVQAQATALYSDMLYDDPFCYDKIDNSEDSYNNYDDEIDNASNNASQNTSSVKLYDFVAPKMTQAETNKSTFKDKNHRYSKK